MESTELAANLFRATQTEEKLRRESIVGEQKKRILRTTRSVQTSAKRSKKLAVQCPKICPLPTASRKWKAGQSQKRLKEEVNDKPLYFPTSRTYSQMAEEEDHRSPTIRQSGDRRQILQMPLQICPDKLIPLCPYIYRGTCPLSGVNVLRKNAYEPFHGPIKQILIWGKGLGIKMNIGLRPLVI